jgi:hypothetical protein
MSAQKQRIVTVSIVTGQDHPKDVHTHPSYTRGVCVNILMVGLSWLYRMFTEDRYSREDPHCHPPNSWQMPFIALPNKFISHSFTLSVYLIATRRGAFYQTTARARRWLVPSISHTRTRLRFIHCVLRGAVGHVPRARARLPVT